MAKHATIRWLGSLHLFLHALASGAWASGSTTTRYLIHRYCAQNPNGDVKVFAQGSVDGIEWLATFQPGMVLLDPDDIDRSRIIKHRLQVHFDRHPRGLASKWGPATVLGRAGWRNMINEGETRTNPRGRAVYSLSLELLEGAELEELTRESLELVLEHASTDLGRDRQDEKYFPEALR